MDRILKDKLARIKHVALDMDGTIYLDDDVFDGAYEFLDKIRTQNKKYIFLTNNSRLCLELFPYLPQRLVIFPCNKHPSLIKVS